MNAITLERVKECFKQKQLSLDLGRRLLIDKDFEENSPLIRALNKCTHLEVLYLNGNDIETVRGLSKLVNLKRLFLNGNRISNISGLDHLQHLQDLIINNNKISAITGLECVSNLKRLHIYHNQISKISGLEKLTQLIQLDISSNQISKISGLDQLKQLEELDISCNQLKVLNIPKNFKTLQKIDVQYNQLEKLSGFKNLEILNELRLSNNNISDIKPLLPILRKNRLKILFKNQWYDSSKILVGNNPITIPPVEIIQQGAKAIINYFFELKKQGTEYLYEAKMLILGQPRAGKTSLRYKLFNVNAELPTEEKTTRGIDIERLYFYVTDKKGKKRKFYYNVWDFGGQQIYQTTHQFFLTHRSLYILVIDTGKDSIGNDDNTVNYWLQALELLGGRSPLLLVKNEKSDRKTTIDIPQKRMRFDFLRNDYGLNLNALIPGTASYQSDQFQIFETLKQDIETELKRLPLVGFPMPKNWVQIRNELQELSLSKHYIMRSEYIEICSRNGVSKFEAQTELSHIFHDLGVFLHFQDYNILEDFIILQNTWATDAVFAVFDNKNVQQNKGRFTDKDLAYIWEDKEYKAEVHRKLLSLMMQFELCYQLEKSKPNVYIVPEMLSDTPPDSYQWAAKDDLTVIYRYDFMPKGILTRLIVRMHRHIAIYKKQQGVWKTGVNIDGNLLDCPNTFAEITEAWNNKELNIRVNGVFDKDLMSKITYEIDQLNDEYFKQVIKIEQSQKSKWYKMIPCNCATCKENGKKQYYDYRKLLERRGFGKKTIECPNPPFHVVNIASLIDGVFAKLQRKSNSIEGTDLAWQTIKIFLASSSELEEERKRFEVFVGRENNRLNAKGYILKLEIWEDFLDKISQTRLQDEYNEAIHGCDVFVMLFFTKVGKYTAEEFEKAFTKFKETNRPAIYTYFKKSVIDNTNINREDTKSLWAFQDKLKELGHFQTEFDSSAALHLHFKNQLEKLYDL